MKRKIVIALLVGIIFSAYAFKEDLPPDHQALEVLIVWEAQKYSCDTYKVVYDIGDYKVRTIKGSLYELQKKGFNVGDIVELSGR